MDVGGHHLPERGIDCPVTGQWEQAEVFAGWSRGRVDGWVQRYSIGVSLLDDAFAPEPGRTAPSALNADERLVGPFVRYELIEDRYAKVINRDMIGVPEFLALGLASTVQLGWASTALGSSHDALLYQASVSRGFVPSPERLRPRFHHLLKRELEGRQFPVHPVLGSDLAPPDV